MWFVTVLLDCVTTALTFMGSFGTAVKSSSTPHGKMWHISLVSYLTCFKIRMLIFTPVHLNQHLFTNAQTTAVSVAKDVPELFAAQDFDVTTALLYLSTGGRMRLQVFVIKGDLNKQDRVSLSFA